MYEYNGLKIHYVVQFIMFWVGVLSMKRSVSAFVNKLYEKLQFTVNNYLLQIHSPFSQSNSECSSLKRVKDIRYSPFIKNHQEDTKHASIEKGEGQQHEHENSQWLLATNSLVEVIGPLP